MPLLDTFPEARQATGFDCGAAALQAVLLWYGFEHKEDRLVKDLGAKPEGVDPAPIAAYLVRCGLSISAGKMTVARLKRWLDLGAPVLMTLQAWTNDPNQRWETALEDGHWVVAIGYDDVNLIVEDPSIMGHRGLIPFYELDRRWHDTTVDEKTYLDHVGIAVHGQKPVYNPGETRRVEASMDLRTHLTRLAHEVPELRAHLVPLLRKEGAETYPLPDKILGRMDDVEKFIGKAWDYGKNDPAHSWPQKRALFQRVRSGNATERDTEDLTNLLATVIAAEDVGHTMRDRRDMLKVHKQLMQHLRSLAI